ncbi:hypothetical protein ADK57_32120 [Streptomyces sp. MMG1533]|uniref:hypothetical protein n=1 Tax=Streptomyces sp. MMG1533 TaxID=1415546 RepID=UPI0006AE7C8F|nr:hypothetical protein [Streptomyces sp. MMG1533]KOU59914.1 hypothetical protein ADK57_32120 [Streptomyces sp. MMG1533]
MTTAVRQAPHHDKLTCYVNYGCRLPECVERYNTNERDRRRQKKTGDYQRYADAAPVRDHVQQLIAAGASPRGIAISADVSDKVVRDLLLTRPDGTRTPLKHRVLTANADKVLAVTADDVVPHYVLALGTIRRLQALVADAWPMNRIAQEAGLFPSYVSQLLWRASAYDGLKVRGTTALAVARAHDNLRGRKATRNGIARKAATTARGIGKSRSWPPTRYWDQHPGAIDDPHFIPEYGKLRAQIIAEEAHWLMTAGRLDRDQAAARLGVSLFSVDRALREHPQTEQELAA